MPRGRPTLLGKILKSRRKLRLLQRASKDFYRAYCCMSEIIDLVDSGYKILHNIEMYFKDVTELLSNSDPNDQDFKEEVPYIYEVVEQREYMQKSIEEFKARYKNETMFVLENYDLLQYLLMTGLLKIPDINLEVMPEAEK